MVGCREVPGGEIRVELSTGRRLAVDYVVLATGYKPDMRKVPHLSGVVDRLELADGFPVLDDHMYVGVESPEDVNEPAEITCGRDFLVG